MMDCKRKVMIIDDDKDLVLLVQDLLEDNGYEVNVAHSIDDAYEKLTNYKPDVILLDINLPDGLGFELCEELRRVSQVPVIFASARTSEDDKVKGLDIGGDDYIAKPFSLKELLSRINSVLRRTYGSKKPMGQIKVAAGSDIMLTIDRACRTVKRNDALLCLSPKEFDLLLYMVEHHDVALTKEQIINDVWGAFCEVEQTTLAVHIRWLREKIEENPSKPSFLKTVWGVGYMCELWKND